MLTSCINITTPYKTKGWISVPEDFIYKILCLIAVEILI